MALHPIDRPRSSALDGPPAIDIWAPISGNDKFSGLGSQLGFGIFFGDIVFWGLAFRAWIQLPARLVERSKTPDTNGSRLKSSCQTKYAPERVHCAA
jgi:hypothetical protein